MTADSFYSDLPRVADFTQLSDPQRYSTLPDSWHVGCCDIVDSTGMIARGQYKTVNMIGAASISALTNAFGNRVFPYVFGGDGTTFAVPADLAATCTDALANLQAWVKAEFDVNLRAALAPMAQLRAERREVTVARYAVAPGVDYAMFGGGGLAWLERQMKSGALSVPPVLRPQVPDLTGLTCRWSNMAARNGIILSLVMEPGDRATPDGFADIAARVIALTSDLADAGHPMPAGGPPMSAWPAGLDLETHMSRGSRRFGLHRWLVLLRVSLSALLFRSGLRLGHFDPRHYVQTMRANTDYRKFDDGLKMTIDCDTALRDRLLECLEQQAATGQIRYGTHEQSEAMVTCIVPSAMRDDHVHFVDGAAGGYAQAAARIKSSGRQTLEKVFFSGS